MFPSSQCLVLFSRNKKASVSLAWLCEAVSPPTPGFVILRERPGGASRLPIRSLSAAATAAIRGQENTHNTQQLQLHNERQGKEALGPYLQQSNAGRQLPPCCSQSHGGC